MNPLGLQTIEVKAFVPAQNFELSLRFYQTLGFIAAWSTGEVAELRHGQSSFLLQKFFVKEHAQNFQMHLLVKSADQWHQHIQSQGIAEEFSVQVSDPEDRPWGVRDFTFIDPTGVLWRVGHSLAS
ncbi:VOC family protein [Luteimonas sp. 3794]|uniref:VOC family protein n=1 Tax=Luteimonas sp. 3794 TaxID=2817730 RepID=UPI0028579A0C|nr:VOC family protein [Luteimonas sp. 3794]MDR6990170.1 hypothetical protein [Luteimonas sp. 3794]